jgi:hypothetical protein
MYGLAVCLIKGGQRKSYTMLNLTCAATPTVDAVMGNCLCTGFWRGGACDNPLAEPQRPYFTITYHGTDWLGH